MGIDIVSAVVRQTVNINRLEIWKQRKIDLHYVKAQNERQRQTALERKHKCRPIRNYIERN